MENSNKLPPVAVCTICGKYVCDERLLDQRCNQIYDGKRCKGWFGSTIGINDWIKCTICGGNGMEASIKCEACQGTGWLFVRK
jgi:hypothetical protein